MLKLKTQWLNIVNGGGKIAFSIFIEKKYYIFSA